MPFNNEALMAAAAQMLQASGPSRTPTGIGQILGGGMQTYMGAAEQARRRKMEEEMMAEKMALIRAQAMAAQQKMTLQKQALDSFGGLGSGTNGLAGGGTGGGEKPTLDQLRRMAIAGVPGAKELFDIHKYENEPQKLEAGSTYVSRTDGKRQYMPKMDNGFTLDANGNAVVVPGYAQGQGEIEGTKAAAVERAKAGFETTTLDLPGGPRMVSKADLPKLMNSAGEEWDGVNKRYKAAQPQRANTQVAILQEELAKTTDPKDRAQIEREIRMAGGSIAAGGPGIALANPLDKERALNESRAATEVKKAGDLATQTSQMSAAKLNKQLMAVIPAAEALLKAGPTGSGIGSLADTAMGFAGISTKSSQYADQLETLGGWLTSNVPRMEGPQSNVDVANYRIQAGNVADRTKPVESRLASLKSLKELVGRYAEGNGMPAAAPEPRAAGSKVATMADIAETARKSGKSTAEVTAALRAKGYTIGGK